MMTPKQAYMRAKDQFDQGHYRASSKLIEPLYRQHPHHPPIVALHVSALLKLQKPSQAIAIAGSSLRTINTPEHRTSLLISITDGLMQLNRFEEAIDQVNKEIENRPDDPQLIDLHAHLHAMTNQNEQAEKVSDQAWQRGVHKLAVATAYARSVIGTDRQRIARDRLIDSLKKPDDSLPTVRSSAYRLLGHLHNKLGDYDDAMMAYRQSNDLHPVQYDDSQIAEKCKLLRETWTPESFVGVPRPSVTGRSPVFIVGMPRSGSTLTEQILDAHPMVFGAGEIDVLNELFFDASPSKTKALCTPPAEYPPKSLQALADQYRQELDARVNDRLTDRSAIAITADKALGNFWYMGMIALAFPDAKIIHCTRDPRDTCLSCFFQGLSAAHSYAFDLASCGRYYRRYHEFVQQMTTVLADPRVAIPVLEMRYEETVADPEGQTRRMLDFVGLDFHEDCLKFYESGRVATTLSNDQVRRPIYNSSVRRHELYKDHLSELNEALADLVEPTVSQSTQEPGIQ